MNLPVQKKDLADHYFWMLLCITAIIAIGRFMITPRLSLPNWELEYEAWAHLFVGGLFGASIYAGRKQTFLSISCLVMGTFVSLLELLMFLIQKYLV